MFKLKAWSVTKSYNHFRVFGQSGGGGDPVTNTLIILYSNTFPMVGITVIFLLLSGLLATLANGTEQTNSKFNTDEMFITIKKYMKTGNTKETY